MGVRRSNRIGLAAALVPVVLVLLLNWRWWSAAHEAQRVNPLLDSPDIPATLAISTMALGPLRGLIANGLWWRATRLQDEGNFFEAVQLSDWITKLQPKLVSVWRYQAWNMSFNISIDVQSPEERWKWVYQGVKLLRDEGLRYNPDDPYIQKEIASIFLKKIAADRDPHSLYFKRQWATIIMRYLPEGGRDELQRIVAAPDSVEELRTDAKVTELLRLAEEQGVELLDFETLHQPTEWPAAWQQLLGDPAHREALEAVRLFLRKRHLRLDQRLDPARLLYIDNEYGPFDWRLPEAHAAYWAAREDYDAFRFKSRGSEMALVRQAMETSFRQGKLVFMDENNFIVANNLAIAGKLHDYLEQLLISHPTPGLRDIVRGFHEFVVVILYNYNYEKDAREIFADYQDAEPIDSERRGKSFEQFIAEQSPRLLRLEGRATDHSAVVQSSLFQAYLALGLGDENRALGYENLARRVWQANQQKHAASNPAKLLPPLADLKAVAVDAAIRELPPEKGRVLKALRDGKALADRPAPTEREALFLGNSHDRESAAEEEAADVQP